MSLNYSKAANITEYFQKLEGIGTFLDNYDDEE